MPNHSVFELRRYRLKPGMRDTLIDVFEQQFVETQEEAGMKVWGTYTDHEDPDAFVWVRSFSDMETRAAALQAFYTGPSWNTHGQFANATMLNSDNMLLLKPSASVTPFALGMRDGSLPKRDSEPSGLITISVASLAPNAEGAFLADAVEKCLELACEC